MALFGGGSAGGLFGALGAGSGGLLGGASSPGRPIVGISESTLSAVFAAQRAQSAVASFNSPVSPRAFDSEAFSLELPDLQTDESINTRVRRVRELASFLDVDRRDLSSVQNDADRTALFRLNVGFESLRTLAEFAALETTTDSTRENLEPIFQQGLAELKAYLSTVETDLLKLQAGSRDSRVETEIGLGKNDNDFDGALIVADADAVISGLSGTEQFTITIDKSGQAPQDIVVDLSAMTQPLTLNNLNTYFNDTIAAVQSTDSEGNLVFDADGNPVSEFNTRFDVYSSNGRFGLQIDGILTESTRLSATSADPAIVVAGRQDPVDEDATARARVVEISGLSGTLTTGDSFSFAGTDLDGTRLAELTEENPLEEEIDPAVAERRDKFLADSLRAVQEANNIDPDAEEEEDDSTIGAENAAQIITDITNTDIVTAETSAGNVAVDSQGNMLVVGSSSGAFGNQLNNAATDDVYLTKLDSQGNVVFARLLGSATSAEAFGVAVDANDNVIVTGSTNSPIAGTDVFDGTDAFVVKYASNGDEQFRYQLDGLSTSVGFAVTTDSAGDIYVGGRSSGAIGGGTSTIGGGDSFLLKLNGSTGAVSDRAILGTTGRDEINDLAIDASGNLIVAAEENGEAVVRKIDSSNLSNTLASGNLGSLGSGGTVGGIAIDSTSGAIFISGTAASDSDLSAGGTVTPTGSVGTSFDGFVAGFTDSGATLDASFSARIGTSGADRLVDIVSVDGKVFVAGTTATTLPGETSVGATDGFLARFDGTTGALEDTQQFGTPFNRFEASGAALNTQANNVLDLLGLPSGDIAVDQTRNIVNQTSVREGDYFTLEFGRRSVRIEVDAGDDLSDISRKIRVSAFGRLDVKVRNSSNGEVLTINTIRGGEGFTLISGENGRDALKGLGLTAGSYFPTDQLFADPDAEGEEVLGGAFGFGIEDPLSITNRTLASFSLGELESAISTVGRAFRSLRPNPLAALTRNQPQADGQASPATLARLSNFQTGLQRLQISNPSSGFSVLA